MKVLNLQLICGGCPTIFEWKNKKGEDFYFRLRNGYARIVNKDTDELICSGSMNGCDGVCSFDEVKEWAKECGVKLKDA